MRAIPLLLLVLGLCGAPRVARAESVLFLVSDPRASELFDALDLELRGFGILLALRPAPVGFTAEAHAAAAHASAREVGASASLWIEQGESAKVRAIATGNGRLIEAPLPAPVSELEPRTFAIVAGTVALDAAGRSRQPDERRAHASESAPVIAEPAPTWSDASARPDATPIVRSPPRARFFLRLAPVAGFALLTRGRAPDRTPAASLQMVDAAARADGVLNVMVAERALLQRGFDCAAEATIEERLRISNCTVALNDPGVAVRPALEGAIGLQWRPASLALTLRVTPAAGRGPLAHALLGVQLGIPLIRRELAGPWLELAGGAGVGQIQVRPSSAGVGAGPYVRSGPGELRGGLLFGYRLLAHMGLYASLMAHGLFPNGLFVLDGSLGLEVNT